MKTLKNITILTSVVLSFGITAVQASSFDSFAADRYTNSQDATKIPEAANKTVVIAQGLAYKAFEANRYTSETTLIKLDNTNVTVGNSQGEGFKPFNSKRYGS